MIDARYSIDAAMFARDLLDFPVDAQQQQVLEIGPSRGILNCSRQWGESTTMAIKAVHRAYFVPKSQVLVIAPTERQSGELVPNGSRIVGLPNVERKYRRGNCG